MPRGSSGQAVGVLTWSAERDELNQVMIQVAVADGGLRLGEIKLTVLSGSKALIGTHLQTCPSSASATALLILQ